MKRLAFCLIVLLASTFTMADEKKMASKKPMAAAKMEILAPADLQWGPAPPVFTAGAKMAVLAGDPGKPGLFTVRLKIPDGYKILPHWHPTDENLTIISGEFHIGAGDKMDESAAKTMPVGSFHFLPAKMHHYAWAKGETVVQVHGPGPFALIYVNPADDPSKAAKK